MSKIIYHPDYTLDQGKWQKWRDTYAAGDAFINKYLQQFTIRESSTDFNRRRNIAYVPAFAKAGLNDIKNAIYRRISDVTRFGGSETYTKSVKGQLNGVDLLGSTMDSFIGQKVLLELLIVSRVGIYVDMPILDGITKNDVGANHPYIYYYPIEDIINWVWDESDSPNQFLKLKLRDREFEYDEDTGFPKSRTVKYRTLYFRENQVFVQFSDVNDEPIDSAIALDIDRIPFIMPTLPHSLLEDVSNYQIALLNLESSDITYCLQANFPFYVEQYDFRAESPYLDNPQSENQTDISTTQGRRYPINTEAPQFIHPSPEPMKASMEKGDRLKKDIRTLINLSVANLGRTDNNKEPLEAGLSYLGMVLEDIENRVADFWAMYEGTEPARINYPIDYALPNPENIREEIDQHIRLINTINSQTYRKEIAKQIVHKTLGTKIPITVLMAIESEIRNSKILVADPDTIRKDMEAGIVSAETASLARGYPDGEVEQAKTDHWERLERIQAAQTPRSSDEIESPAARGLHDLAMDNQDSKIEKARSQNVDLQPDLKKPVRGPDQLKRSS